MTEITEEAPTEDETAPEAEEAPKDIDGIFDAAFDKTEPPAEDAEETDDRGRDDPIEAEEEPADEKPEEEQEEQKTGFDEAPDRFNKLAKDAWKDVPVPVRAEIDRAISEMTAGIEKYKEPAERWNELAEFDEICRQNNTDLKTAFQRFNQAEQMLVENPMKGLDFLVQRTMGKSLNELAEQIVYEEPTAQTSQYETKISELQNQIAQQQAEMQRITGALQEQEASRTQAQIDAFAAEHPRFEELRVIMGRQIQSGQAKTLEEAYEIAERINPAPRAQETGNPAPQTRKGAKQVKGRTGSGSSRTQSPDPKNIDDVFDQAFARAGL